MSTRWQKIMKVTGCSEKEARTASRALALLGEIKGTALTMSGPVSEYMIDRLAIECGELSEPR